MPAGLCIDNAEETDVAIGVPVDDWEAGVAERSRSINDAVDEDRSFDGTFDWEGTCRFVEVPSAPAFRRDTGEPVLVFFGLVMGEVCGEIGRLRLRLKSASSLDLYLTFPLELSSETFPLSDPRSGEAERTVSIGSFVLALVPRTPARRVPVPIPIQALRCGAYLFEATERLHTAHSNRMFPSFVFVGVFVPLPGAVCPPTGAKSSFACFCGCDCDG